MDFFNEKIRNYIASNLDLDNQFKYEKFMVGRSNITFKIFDKRNSYVLRRPPFGDKLESAHNMQREYRIISELSENNLKVPKPIFLCTDRTVSDDDFYIMEYIEGETIADNVVAENYSKNDKKEITNSFITTLSELHTFDVKNSKLNDLGKHEDYVLRQLNRWTKQFNAQKVRDITDLDIATKLLFDTIPTQQKVSIVHGDYRLDNVIAENYSKNDKKEITNSFITTLAELHNFDVKNSKLNDLGKHEDYVLRQLNRWTKQFNAQKVRDIADLDIATKLLFDTIPTQQKVSIVHGDYRLDNVRVNNNLVAAIVDWELCTLGDPLADLGTVIASWSNKNETDTPFIYSPSLSDGFPSRQEIINLYDSKSDLDLKNVEFYVRLSFWKHAMIMEGVYVRYSLGYYGNVDKEDVEAFGKSTLSFAKKASNKNLLKEIF